MRDVWRIFLGRVWWRRKQSHDTFGKDVRDGFYLLRDGFSFGLLHSVFLQRKDSGNGSGVNTLGLPLDLPEEMVESRKARRTILRAWIGRGDGGRLRGRRRFAKEG